MNWLDRLIGKLSLIGPRRNGQLRHDALWASADRAAEDLTETARDLNQALKRYQESSDPFTALVVDLHNRRAEALTSDPEWLKGAR